jgi:septal ring factor EnvC (AmiA/AmiB activator)
MRIAAPRLTPRTSAVARAAQRLVVVIATASVVGGLVSWASLAQPTPPPTPPPSLGPTSTAPAPAAPSSLAESQESLARMRAELEHRRAALDTLASAENSLVESLGALDESLGALKDAQRRVQSTLERLQAERAGLEREAGLDEAELERLRARLRARLITLSVEGEGQAARALLGAESFTDLALRRHLLARVADTDARLVHDVRRIEASAAKRRTELVSRTHELEQHLRLQTEQQALMSATKEERTATLERIRGERSVLQRAQVELTVRHRELQLLVARLADGPRALPPSGRSGVLRQGLLFPVAGAVVIRRFGSIVDADTKAELVSNGLELRADEGKPVVAVADGRVAHSGWLRGFGRIVIVDHGEGHHTLSAHLSEAMVERGQEVQRGQTIGLVGDTESLNGPKLYFELREGGRPRDPLPFLRR